MKYIIIIGDGMGDLPVPELQNRTPLEAARTPHLDEIAQKGRLGLMQTIFPNLPVGSIVANMGILGYDPYQYYPHGRASFEALAKGITLDEGDLAFRCNLISLANDCIKDFTARQISDGEALTMLTHLKVEKDGLEIEIFPGMSYRNLLIIRNANIPADEIVCFEPHMNIGQEIHGILPQGRSPAARAFIPVLRKILLKSIEQFNELNKKFHTQADMVWLWSPSSRPDLPDILDKFGVSGGVVCGMDFLKGIGLAAGMRTEHIPNTNAYIDTNYAGKLETAIKYLKSQDLVYVHINAPDEEGHKRDVKGKVKSIELIDEKIIGPLFKFCENAWPDDYRLMILPDHYTLLRDGTHTSHQVPVVLFGKGVKPDAATKLTEDQAGADGRDRYGRSYHFLQDFLHKETFGD
ncbi:MAG: 2,3-bisphosphoglycerate-independent phosphoglycerate mutase [Deferribacteres bacterium]|nr:2,3-bisphosphoglycerate-independent phosphoglycerate mutase [candidate division KSB1 bacterium]MCB9511021.1 2,3-bisphosphoglycerate-independent phosphoglycerate mutase [Deferribacteres bacterium]